MTNESELDRKFNDVEQDVMRFVRHCAMRNNVEQDFVIVAVKSVINNHFKL
jgi:hypothetical protein